MDMENYNICMKRFLLTVIGLTGLFLSFSGYGQDTIAKMKYKTKNIEKIERPNAIFFAPFNFFDFQNPNFQIAYERFVTKKWAVQVDGAIMLPHSILQYLTDGIYGVKNCPYTNNGFRIKGSVKHFLVNQRILKLYISPEFFYYKNKSGMDRYFLISGTDKEPSQFFYNQEEKMGTDFKVGFKLCFGKYFFVEPHVGLGLAYRNVIQTGKENHDEMTRVSYNNHHDYACYSLEIFDKAAPYKWVPTIPLNCKIGFRF